jgi:hypothetical protein
MRSVTSALARINWEDDPLGSDRPASLVSFGAGIVPSVTALTAAAAPAARTALALLATIFAVAALLGALGAEALGIAPLAMAAAAPVAAAVALAVAVALGRAFALDDDCCGLGTAQEALQPAEETLWRLGGGSGRRAEIALGALSELWTLVAGVPRLALVPRIPRLTFIARVPGLARFARVPGLARLPRIAGLAGKARVAGLTLIAVVAGLGRFTAGSGSVVFPAIGTKRGPVIAVLTLLAVRGGSGR